MRVSVTYTKLKYTQYNTDLAKRAHSMQEAQDVEVGNALDSFIGIAMGHEFLGNVSKLLALADDFTVFDREATVGE